MIDFATFFSEWGGSFIFLLGLIIGSFLNVVILRLPKGVSLSSPPSRCPKCKNSVRAVDNIPVLSWLLLKGRCRACQEKISIRYPLTELATGGLFLLTYHQFGYDYGMMARILLFVGIAIVVFEIDLDHRIIPDKLSIPGAFLGLLTSFWDTQLTPLGALIGAAFGFCFFYGISWAYYKIKGQMGLGGGDIKFLALVGAFIGLDGVLFTVLFSSIIGSLVGIAYAMIKREESVMQAALPFGPFLVTGALVFLFFGEPLWRQFMSLM